MVLITGGAGLVGTALIDQLAAKGKSIRAIYNKHKINHSYSNIEEVQCSILDVIKLEESMKGISEIYHCAGLVSFSPGDVDALYKINVEGTANIVNAALVEGVRKAVHVSSVAALGRLRQDEMVSEKMQWTQANSNSKYGESKYRGEMEVWRGIGEGLNAVIVNPAIILGAGNWDTGSTAIFKSAYNEFPWYTKGFSGFVDVRDVAAAMIMLMESDVSGERFILSAENKSYREIFNMIAKGFNKKIPSQKVTPFLASMVWKMQSLKSMFDGRKPLLTRETAATSMAIVKYDNSKLLRLFPSFKYTDLQKTITDTCLSLQQKLNNL